MTPANTKPSRRMFLQSAISVATGTAALSMLPATVFSQPVFSPATPDDDLNIIGPKEGYSPQIGTLVSMMTWMRTIMLYSVKGMTTEQLDFLIDNKANTIGALLFHLAATDTFYHAHTMGGVDWGKWDQNLTDKFGTAMELGDNARKAIKGNNLDFYLNLLHETREKTLAEFKKRDDQWLLAVDSKWPWGPTNNYCKWFHVCEHESNHNGQIKFLKSRLPGAKPGGE
jgi:hypothetical protein